MDKLITTSSGGIPIILDDLRWLTGQESNQAIIQAVEDLLRGEVLSDDFIVSGLVLSGSNPIKSLTAGWVMLGGDLLQVAARTADIDDSTDNRIILSTTNNSAGLKTLLNGSTADTYQQNRGIVSGTSGNLDIRTPKRIMDLLDDTYKTPTFAAGDYSVTGGGSWTVEAGDVATYRFRILGKTMFMEIVIGGSTIGSAPVILTIALPESKKTANAWQIASGIYDNGATVQDIKITATVSGVDILIQKIDDTAFTNGTNNQDIKFNTSFEIE